MIPPSAQDIFDKVFEHTKDSQETYKWFKTPNILLPKKMSPIEVIKRGHEDKLRRLLNQRLR